MTAMPCRRWSHSVGALVTSVELKSVPAASRNVCGSDQIGGRGLGNGASSAMASRSPVPARQQNAISRRKATEPGARRGETEIGAVP